MLNPHGKYGNNMSKNFWIDKLVLVTGATGFIGSWLTEALVNKGAIVTAFVKKDDPIGLDSIKHLTDKLKVKYGDIREMDAVSSAVEDQDITFHLAAITQVSYSVKNPRETVEIDVNGTFNVLEAIRKSNNNSFLVFASTDKVYGEPQYTPIDEKHPLLAKSPYDASKLAADRLVYSYFTTYGSKSSTIRWSNTIGGRDSNILRVAPDFIRSTLNNKPPIIRGHGQHIRDFMFVEDTINAAMAVGENQKVSNGEAFNFGTGKPTKVLDFAKLIIKLTGNENKLEPVVLYNPTPGEIERQYLSFDKAKEKLGWVPRFSLEEGLKKSIDWYSKNMWWFAVVDKVSKFYDKNM